MMSFLKRLFGGGQAREPEDKGLYLYVRCDNCGAVLHTRADPERDAEPTETGWHLRKEMMDDCCFRLIYADVDFDRSRNLVGGEVEGGTIITREEWLAGKDHPR